jgi:hypothetical protein
LIRREVPPARLESPPRRLRGRLPEGRPIDLNTLVTPYLGVIVVALSVMVLVLILVAFIQARRQSRLRRKLDGLTRGADGRSLEALLDAHLSKVFAVARELDDLAARSAVLEAGARRAIQRVGLVRYNPFEETGGNQSFALALTDGSGDGFVVSSLHARSGTRVYAKAVVGGRSDSALSQEEAEALRLAMAAPAGRPTVGPADRARATV